MLDLWALPKEGLREGQEAIAGVERGALGPVHERDPTVGGPRHPAEPGQQRRLHWPLPPAALPWPVLSSEPRVPTLSTAREAGSGNGRPAGPACQAHSETAGGLVAVAPAHLYSWCHHHSCPAVNEAQSPSPRVGGRQVPSHTTTPKVKNELLIWGH